VKIGATPSFLEIALLIGWGVALIGLAGRTGDTGEQARVKGDSALSLWERAGVRDLAGRKFF